MSNENANPNQILAFSDRDLGARERLEDFSVDKQIRTQGGLALQIAMVCDGVGGGEVGERASFVAAQTILEYLERSPERNIPLLLTQAVQAANQRVHAELQGAGNTTVAMIAIDMADNPPYGRLYIASVGDSPIFLLRNGRMIRLNTDHTVANDMLLRGEITPEQMPYVERGSALTRAIGVHPTVNVDYGFYTEQGRELVTPDRAAQLGQRGLALQEGDTVFASSDGLVEPNPVDGKPFVREEEFLRHALDLDPERAGRMLMSYASARGPRDNFSISLVFIPSKQRKVTRAMGMSGRARGIVAALVAMLAVVIIGAILALSQSSDELSDSEETQVALGITVTAQEQAREDATSTAAAATSNAAATATAATPTPTATLTPTATPPPTVTPTPTATPRPERVSDLDVGNQYFAPGSGLASGAVEEDATIRSDTQPSYLLLRGTDLDLTDPANFYLQPGSQMVFGLVDERRQEIELVLSPGSDVFIESGTFAVDGIIIELEGRDNWTVESNAAVFAVRYTTTELVVTCYAAQEEDDCRVFPPRQTDPLTVPAGQRLVADLVQPNPATPGEVTYDDAVRYFETVRTLTQMSQPDLRPIVDDDADTVLNNDDLCPEDAGPVEDDGCPDSDGDSLHDAEDRCPQVFGASRDGCPLPTATQTPNAATRTPGASTANDADGDGVLNDVDGCPLEFGEDENGCPFADADGDGSPDYIDGCPDDPGKTNPGACGCGTPETDTDNDGTPNCIDDCPTDPGKTDPGTCGCGNPDTDSDGDGTPDCNDNCPADAGKINPGACGCGSPDTDSDGDGTPDCNDNCPADAGKTNPGACGCGNPDTDSDGDGTPNCNDNCPADAGKTDPGACGCGSPDTDTDGDGTPDCNDNCPTDATKTDPGTCGCGIPDTDSDSDGTPDCVDPCPADPTDSC